MGMSIAVKWTGCFFAIGLAILFFIKFVKDNIGTNVIYDEENKIISKNKKWNKESLITILACIVFFVIVPLSIYLLQYIPHIGANSIKEIWNLQTSALEFHKNLNGNHSFASKWYTWFIMYKPVWHYDGKIAEGIRSTISGIGNPIIWWLGLLATIYVFIKTLIKRKKENYALTIIIITSILPYVCISRESFMYYYFPILPFMMLCIVAFIRDIESKIKFKYIWVVCSIIFSIIFAFFYPVVAGVPVSEEYIDMTQWLESWYY